MKKPGKSCLILLLLCSALSAAGDKSSPTLSPRVVHFSDCKIALIDHVVLASDRSGILRQVTVKEGDSVDLGSLIAMIDDRVARANLSVEEKKATNEVEIKYAEAAYENATSELNSYLGSNDNMVPSTQSKPKPKPKGGKFGTDLDLENLPAVAKMEIEKARLAQRKAELSVDQAKHELALNKLKRDASKAELDTYSVNAEFAGIVVKIHKKKGEAVRQGDPVAEIVNTDRVRIEGRVSLEDLPYAKRGASVLVRLFVEELDLPEEKEVFEGKITFVDVVSDPIDQSTRIHAEVINRDNILRAGLEAVMELEVDDAATAKRQQRLDNPADEKPHFYIGKSK